MGTTSSDISNSAFAFPLSSASLASHIEILSRHDIDFIIISKFDNATNLGSPPKFLQARAKYDPLGNLTVHLPISTDQQNW
jgi:hypothetical protein